MNPAGQALANALIGGGLTYMAAPTLGKALTWALARKVPSLRQELDPDALEDPKLRRRLALAGGLAAASLPLLSNPPSRWLSKYSTEDGSDKSAGYFDALDGPSVDVAHLRNLVASDPILSPQPRIAALAIIHEAPQGRVSVRDMAFAGLKAAPTLGLNAATGYVMGRVLGTVGGLSTKTTTNLARTGALANMLSNLFFEGKP